MRQLKFVQEIPEMARKDLPNELFESKSSVNRKEIKL